MASVVDPLGGAYEIEYLTDRIQSEAEEYLARIEEMGGALVAVDRGYFAGEIAKEAYRSARAREAGEELVVGVNAFSEGNPGFSLFPGEPGGRFQRISPTEERRQLHRVRAWRRTRDARRSVEALAELERSTRAGENVMPGVLAAVVAGATLGEIADAWRGLFGEQRGSQAY